MKLIINTASTFKGGGVQAALSFIDECRKFGEHTYHIILGERLAGLVNPELFPGNFTFHKIQYRPATRVFGLDSHDRFFRELETKVKPDVVFTTSGPAYWRPEVSHLAGYNLPHYIYRDSPFFSQIPFYRRLKWDAKGRVIIHFFKKDADAYVVQTEDVNERVRKLLNTDNVYTVSNTCSRHYLNPVKVPDKLPEKKESEFRLLTLSAWYPHKNLSVIKGVIDAFPNFLKQKIRFVLTIPQEIFNTEFSEKYREYILNVGPVKPEEGPSLYKECDALFLPTLLECFSASYPEAMAMEKPVLTSDLGFARAICGDAALYFNPVDPFIISKKVEELVLNPVLQKELVEKGKKQLNSFLTAEQRAKEYLRICQKLANTGKN